MHDILYAHFREISAKNIFVWAKDIGLDLVRFTADLNSGKYKQLVVKEMNDGMKAGVQGTPTIFVNGKRYNGPIEIDVLETVLAGELKAVQVLAPR